MTFKILRIALALGITTLFSSAEAMLQCPASKDFMVGNDIGGGRINITARRAAGGLTFSWSTYLEGELKEQDSLSVSVLDSLVNEDGSCTVRLKHEGAGTGEVELPESIQVPLGGISGRNVTLSVEEANAALGRLKNKQIPQPITYNNLTWHYTGSLGDLNRFDHVVKVEKPVDWNGFDKGNVGCWVHCKGPGESQISLGYETPLNLHDF